MFKKLRRGTICNDIISCGGAGTGTCTTTTTESDCKVAGYQNSALFNYATQQAMKAPSTSS